MAKRDIKFSICRSYIWKETAKRLKHYRKYYSIDEYNQKIGPIIDLYRKTDSDVSLGLYIERKEYIEKLAIINKDLQKVI